MEARGKVDSQEVEERVAQELKKLRRHAAELRSRSSNISLHDNELSQFEDKPNHSFGPILEEEANQGQTFPLPAPANTPTDDQLFHNQFLKEKETIMQLAGSKALIS